MAVRDGRWARWLVLICAGALALRLGYVLGWRWPVEITGDAYQYHHGANLLVDGYGFIDAFDHLVYGRDVQTALHAPLYTVALAIPSALGLRSPLAHLVWSCALGTATVAAVGLVGRRLGANRTGLIAAGLAAVYPNLWIYDGMLAVETLFLLATAMVLLAAYRLWERPDGRRALELGLACGAAALSRSEALLFVPLMVVPAALRAAGDWRGRAHLVGLAAVGTAAVVGPYTIYNVIRMDQPVLIATPEVAMMAGNCDDTFYGTGLGYWSVGCYPQETPPPGDGSVLARSYRGDIAAYVGDNLGRLPVVVAARVGRAWGIYEPLRQTELDAYVEGRDLPVARAGLTGYYALLGASVPGVLLLRRRQVPLSPMVALAVTATLTAAFTYGHTRYRVAAELVPLLLAAVGVERLLSVVGLGRRRRLGGQRPAAGKGDPEVVEASVSGGHPLDDLSGEPDPVAPGWRGLDDGSGHPPVQEDVHCVAFHPHPHGGPVSDG